MIPSKLHSDMQKLLIAQTEGGRTEDQVIPLPEKSATGFI